MVSQSFDCQCVHLYVMVYLLKLTSFHKYLFLFALMKGRSEFYASLHCDQYGHLRTWNIYNAGTTLYRDLSRLVEFHHIWKKTSYAKYCGDSKQAHVFVIYWYVVLYSLLFVTVYLRDFTGIRESLNAMKLPFKGMERTDCLSVELHSLMYSHAYLIVTIIRHLV